MSAIVYSRYVGAVGGLQSITKAMPAVKKARSFAKLALNKMAVVWG